MSKTLNETAIANELRGSSGFFHGPPPAASSPATGKTTARADRAERSNRTVEPNGRTAEPTAPPLRVTESPTVLAELTQGIPDENGRPTERYSFEIYTDQRRRLTDIQGRHLLRTGKKISLSRIIREALDAYLDKLDAAV